MSFYASGTKDHSFFDSFVVVVSVHEQRCFYVFPRICIGLFIVWQHALCHTCMLPPFKWMQPLWRNHHLHHYKEKHLGFGVSTTIWDHVFGTMFDLKNEQEEKEKVDELMFEKK